VLRPEIFTHARDSQRLTVAHTRRGTGVPPTKKSWKLKICLKIQRARVHNFRNSGSIFSFTKLFHATCHYCERNFVLLKLILHSDLRRRAASLLALPCSSSFFSPVVLQAPSTDRPETLPHDQNLAEFYNPTPKIRGGGGRGCSPKKIWVPKNAKFRSILDHFLLWPRISRERGNVSKIGKTYELAKFLLRLMKKVRWSLVH